MSTRARRLKFEEGRSRRKVEENDVEALDKIYDNLKQTFAQAVDGSDFIDEKNIELDGIQAIREKERKLLYKKFPITGEMTPDEIFWRKWGKRKDFEAGVLDGKCAKYLKGL